MLHALMKYGTYIKSSLIDPRCCDNDPVPSDTVTTGWRALISSITCVLDNGRNTGYVNVHTLEQYTLSNGQPTGLTKLNTPSDPDYIGNYINISMCPTANQGIPLAELFAFNGCSGVLNINLVNQADNNILYNLTVDPSQTLSFQLIAGNYDVNMHCSQSTPDVLHVLQTCNGVTKIAASDQTAGFTPVATPVNISVRPTPDPVNI